MSQTFWHRGLCNLSTKEGNLEFIQENDTHTVTIPGEALWRHARLGSIAITEGTLPDVQIAGMSGGVYLDQLYLVMPEQRGTFEALPADWWM